jgi:hypothetical protein
MKAIRLSILLLLLPLIGVAPEPGVAADPPLRLALVIANSTYEVLPPLPQCSPAARNMAAALKDAGFEVSEEYDVTNATMNAALISFARKASAQSVLIAYYCGYLAVFNDRPFLVPKSAELVALNRIMTEGIAASALINVMIRTRPHQGLAILDVAPAPDKSDPVIETTFPVANPPPPAVMLAISQPVPGGPGNVLAERLRGASVNLRTLLESARADWGEQPGTMVALTAMPSEDLYLRGEPPPHQPAPTSTLATPSTDRGNAETSDVESQMSRPERWRVQARLRALGYYQGNVDAVFGPLTRDAIRRYQSANGLPQTGQLGITEATQLLFFDARQKAP